MLNLHHALELVLVPGNVSVLGRGLDEQDGGAEHLEETAHDSNRNGGQCRV